MDPSKPVKTHQKSHNNKNGQKYLITLGKLFDVLRKFLFLAMWKRISTGELRKWPFHWPQKSWTCIRRYITKVIVMHDELWWDESAKVCRGKPSRTSDTNAAREVLSSSLDKKGLKTTQNTHAPAYLHTSHTFSYSYLEPRSRGFFCLCNLSTGWEAKKEKSFNFRPRDRGGSRRIEQKIGRQRKWV